MILQFIKFGVVGVIATLVDMGVLVILTELFHVNVLVALAISFSVSVVVNYILSMAFVFKGKGGNKAVEFAVFVILSIGGLGLTELIAWAGLTYTEIHYLIIKFFTLVIVTLYNFITRKIFIESKAK